MSDASALASALAKKFRDLAIRFRRIDADTPATAQRQVGAAGAWGAELVKQAQAAGIISLPDGWDWPKTGKALSDDSTSDWQTRWVLIVQLMQHAAPGELPSNPNAITWRELPTEQAERLRRGGMGAADWRIRCENYAIAADALADLVMRQGAISIEDLNTPAAPAVDLNSATPAARAHDDGQACKAGYPIPDDYERDKWIYEQRKAGKTNPDIIRELGSRSGWTPLYSEDSIRDAVKRYCLHHGLSVPQGRRGRPTTKNRENQETP